MIKKDELRCEKRTCENCMYKHLGLVCKNCATVPGGNNPTRWKFDGNVKEKSMKSNRLAEILGVETKQKFTAYGSPSYGNIWVDENGFIQNDGLEPVTLELLATLINCPSCLKVVPQLTEAEVAICKAVGAKYVSSVFSSDTVMLTRFKPEWDKSYEDWMCSIESEGPDPVARVKKGLFPSVPDGACVKVGE